MQFKQTFFKPTQSNKVLESMMLLYFAMNIASTFAKTNTYPDDCSCVDMSCPRSECHKPNPAANEFLKYLAIAVGVVLGGAILVGLGCLVTYAITESKCCNKQKEYQDIPDAKTDLELGPQMIPHLDSVDESESRLKLTSQ